MMRRHLVHGLALALLGLTAAPIPAARATGHARWQGLLVQRGEPWFSIRDTRSGRTVWLTVGQSLGSLRVVAFDEAGRRLYLAEAGEAAWHTLHHAPARQPTDPTPAERDAEIPGGDWRELSTKS